jgi:hypothetical protein
VDFWPYQKPAKENNVPARTLANLRSTYTALRADPDWVKTYSLSSRYFHLLGPMYSGKPQVYEAFYNWMAPLGTGLLNQHAGPEMFNLLGARYIVFDRTDLQMDQRIAAQFRQAYPVALENEDFVVFSNAAASAYVTGYARACAHVGDIRQSAALALKLSAQRWPLIEWDGAGQAGRFEAVYREGMPVVLPKRAGQLVNFSDLRLARDNAGLIRIRLNSPASCLAVVAESWFPFWRAEVDGKPVPVLRVSCGLMGVELPAGSHEIVLRYRTPGSYAVAGIVSLIALAVGCVATIGSCRAGRS